MDVPPGVTTEEHLDGLTLVFREEHALWERGVHRGLWQALAAFAATAVIGLALAGLLGLAFESDPNEIAFGLLGASVLLFPGAVAIAGLVLAGWVYRDAGRTHVHLTVGVRGIVVERPALKQTTVFPPTTDLAVRVVGERMGRIAIVGAGDAVEIGILARPSTVQWIADRIAERCAQAGDARHVPQQLRELPAAADRG